MTPQPSSIQLFACATVQMTSNDKAKTWYINIWTAGFFMRINGFLFDYSYSLWSYSLVFNHDHVNSCNLVRIHSYTWTAPTQRAQTDNSRLHLASWPTENHHLLRRSIFTWSKNAGWKLGGTCNLQVSLPCFFAWGIFEEYVWYFQQLRKPS